MPDPVRPAGGAARFAFFRPILPGATLRERALACLGALFGIGVAGFVTGRVVGLDSLLPLIVAPMGASTVLLFAVPASPLAQPWPIIGGNTISALVGIAVARLVPDPALAVGLAVALAIAAMSLTRSLHPPGGAAALTAVIGGPVVAGQGFAFAFLPVGLNALLLVAAGLVFHRLAGRTYPHRAAPSVANPHKTADPLPSARVGFQAQDVDAALAALDETFDIDRDDLDRLLREVERRALRRAGDGLACAAIMSRDVIAVPPDAPVGTARRLLLDHDLRLLPVLDPKDRLVGVVGLREIAAGAGLVRDVMTKPVTVAADDPAFGLVSRFIDGAARAMVVVGPDGRVEGLISQSEILALLARTPFSVPAGA